jgi:protein O-GlcNAc transferase
MAESSIDQLLETAKDHHRAGRYADADPLYRRYLAMKPDSAEAAHLLGYLTFEMGKTEAGVELIRRAIALDPNKAEFYCNLGVLNSHLQRHEEALEALRKALSIKPDFPEAWYNLAGPLFARQKIPETIEAYRKAISLRPNYPDAYNNLANVLVIEGRLEEAITAYQQALVLRPNFAVAASNLGTTLRKVGRLEESLAWLRHAIAVEPEYRDGCRNLALFLRERAQWPEAIAMYRRVLYLHHNDPELEIYLADSLRGAGEFDEAIGVYERNLARRPGTPVVYRGLAQAYEARGDLKNAAEAYKQAVKLQGDFVEVLCELGNLNITLGKIHAGLECFTRAITVRPTDPLPYSHRLSALHYLTDIDPAVIFHEHVDWNQKHAQPLNYEIRQHDVDRDPNRRLRIAYVSPNFRAHPIGYFTESIIANHNPAQVETFAYADLLQSDATTARLQKLFHQFRNTTGMSDQNLSEMIRADKIDVLIDLAGHTPGNRLLVFARKPAPIQITYLGYPDTTGLSAMDYRLSDVHADPPGQTEAYYSEKLVRLPRSFLVYRPPAEAPEVSPLPAIQNGFITFGSFNELPKLSFKTTDLWIQILKATTNSHLLLKNPGLSDPETRNEFLQRFTAAGIEASRIDLRAASPTIQENLKTYSEIDIALDTFPFNGDLTTCEAMWMGLPIITLAGSTYASRIGASLLTNIRLPELIAQSEDQYIHVAVDLTKELEALAEIRDSIREWLTESPIVDGRRWTWNIEAQLRVAWKDYLASTSPVEAQAT